MQIRCDQAAGDFGVGARVLPTKLSQTLMFSFFREGHIKHGLNFFTYKRTEIWMIQEMSVIVNYKGIPVHAHL